MTTKQRRLTRGIPSRRRPLVALIPTYPFPLGEGLGNCLEPVWNLIHSR
ncbi:hypothetical protein [Thermostichus sp. OS-CIW-26]